MADRHCRRNYAHTLVGCCYCSFEGSGTSWLANARNIRGAKRRHISSRRFVNFPRGCEASKFCVGGHGALGRPWWYACGLVAVFAGGKVEDDRTVILSRKLSAYHEGKVLLIWTMQGNFEIHEIIRQSRHPINLTNGRAFLSLREAAAYLTTFDTTTRRIHWMVATGVQAVKSIGLWLSTCVPVARWSSESMKTLGARGGHQRRPASCCWLEAHRCRRSIEDHP